MVLAHTQWCCKNVFCTLKMNKIGTQIFFESGLDNLLRRKGVGGRCSNYFMLNLGDSARKNALCSISYTCNTLLDGEFVRAILKV